MSENSSNGQTEHYNGRSSDDVMIRLENLSKVLSWYRRAGGR